MHVDNDINNNSSSKSQLQKTIGTSSHAIASVSGGVAIATSELNSTEVELS